MKRALLVLAALLAALALLWLVSRRATAGDAPSVAPAATTTDVEDTPPADLESGLSEDRAELSLSASEAKKQATSAARRAREAKPTAPPIKTSPVTLIVAFAESGKPIGPSLANLSYITTDGEMVPPLPDSHRMTPKGEGRFVIDVPAGARLKQATVCGTAEMLAGPHTQQNEASRFTPLYAPLDRLVGDEAVEIRLEATPGQEISGVVLDARSRRPVSEAKVSVPTAVGRSLRLYSDKDGRFRFADPGANPRMRFEAEGYCTLEQGLASEMLVLLDPVLHVAGRVVDARGAPVQGLSLGLSVRHADRAGPGRPLNLLFSADTDDEGRFRFEGVPPFEESLLNGSNHPSLSAHPYVINRELGPTHEDLDGLVLVAQDRTQLSIRVVRPDGTPAPRSCIVLCVELDLLAPGFHDLFEDGFSTYVPAGAELNLVALAPTGQEDPNRVLVGRQKCVAGASEDEEREVLITLSESLDYEPSPSDAQVIELSDSWIQATLDLRLLDKSGNPLPSDTRIVLTASSEDTPLRPTDGWVRLRGQPGRELLRLRCGDEFEVVQVTLPWNGYERVEKRLRIAP